MKVRLVAVLTLGTVIAAQGVMTEQNRSSRRMKDERPMGPHLDMHFWATDDAAALARGLKAALDQTNSRK